MSNFEVTLKEDAFARAEELATVMGISEVQALGHLSYLWRWILTLRIGAPPDGIVRGRASCKRLEGAARWRGKPGALVDALVELGLVTRERKKLRVKGTKPYADEWKRKDGARKRERTRRLEQKAAALKNGERPQLTVVKKQLQLSDDGLKWWVWAMRERARDRIKPGADPFGPRAHIVERDGVPSDADPPKTFGTWFDERMKDGTSASALCNAWIRFLGDDHFASREWPLPIFMSDGVYRKRITKTA